MRKLLFVLALIVSVGASAQTTTHGSVNRGGIKFETLHRYQAHKDAIYDTIKVEVDILTTRDSIVLVSPEIVGIDTTFETGRLVGVEVNIAPNLSISVPHKRTLELLSMTEETDLELIVQMQVNYYDLSGRKMIDVIAQDTTLSIDARAQKERLFSSYVVTPKRTRGSFVNPLTGGLVAEGTPGAVAENQFYQSLTINVLRAMGLFNASETRPDIMRKLMTVYMLSSIAARDGI